MAWRRTTHLLRRIAGTPPNPRVFPVPVPPKRAVIVGSSGCLGRSIVRHLRQAHPYLQILGIDVMEDTSDDASGLTQFWNVASATGSLRELTQSFVQGVEHFTNVDEAALSKDEQDAYSYGSAPSSPSHNQLDILICAAGGWAGDPGPPPDDDDTSILAHAAQYAETIDTMRRINLEPALAMAYLLQPRYLHFPSHPLSVFLGATAALQPTPGMLGYGLSKVATHHVAQTIAATTSAMVPKSLKHSNGATIHDDRLTILTVLPSVLDTPGNASIQTSTTKTPVDAIAQQIASWSAQPALRPHTGAWLKVSTQQKQGSNHEDAASKSTTQFQIVR